MKITAVITDPGECNHSLEVNKIPECLKRNNTPPSDKVEIKASLSGPYSISQDMMISQDEVRSFYSPKDVRSLFLSQFS